MAIATSNSEDVRSFGQKMVADHSKKNGELEALAAKKNIALPTKLDAKHQETLAKLGSLSGDAAETPKSEAKRGTGASCDVFDRPGDRY